MTVAQAAVEIDRYAGAAGDIDPALGTVAVPVRLLVALRQAIRDERRETKDERGRA